MIDEYNEYHSKMKKYFLSDMEAAQMLVEEAKHLLDKQISTDTALQYVMHHDRLRALVDIENACGQ